MSRTVAGTLSSTTNQWETLTVPLTSGNPNLAILYSESTTGTGEFYADNAYASGPAVPEPASWILALIALPALAIRVRKVRRTR